MTRRSNFQFGFSISSHGFMMDDESPLQSLVASLSKDAPPLNIHDSPEQLSTESFVDLNPLASQLHEPTPIPFRLFHSPLLDPSYDCLTLHSPRSMSKLDSHVSQALTAFEQRGTPFIFSLSSPLVIHGMTDEQDALGKKPLWTRPSSEGQSSLSSSSSSSSSSGASTACSSWNSTKTVGLGFLDAPPTTTSPRPTPTLKPLLLSSMKRSPHPIHHPTPHRAFSPLPSPSIFSEPSFLFDDKPLSDWPTPEFSHPSTFGRKPLVLPERMYFAGSGSGVLRRRLLVRSELVL